MSCSFLGQSLFDLLCQFVVVQSPLLGKLLGFILGQVNHGSMLRLGEVGGEYHAALVETSQLLEVLEVRGCLLDAWSSVVGYVEEMVFALCITDVAVNGCLVFDRIFE